MNNMTLIGRLAADPEIRTSKSGSEICVFTVASDQKRGDGTDFFKCYAWGQQGANINKWFRKGKPIMLDGYMQSRKWTNKQGVELTLWEFNTSSWGFVPADKTEQKPEPQQSGTALPSEDDLPF